MRAVLQRVRQAEIRCTTGKVESIGYGLVILLGIHREDQQEDLQYLVSRIPDLRIFPDAEGVNNLSLLDVQQAGQSCQALVASQFTLHADTTRGRRPYYGHAAPAEQAIPLYEAFLDALADRVGPLASGQFGDRMEIEMQAWGPMTILLDSREERRKR